MICGFCGKEIPDKVGLNSCGGCGSRCRKIHCPYCGYANPAPGKFLERLLKSKTKKEED